MQFYNHTRQLFQSGNVDLTALKVMLVNGYTLDATQTAIATASASQVSGNGWTAGGELIANAAVTTVTTNDSKLDGDDISVTASGGDIGPADGLVIYDSSANDNPLFYYSFASAQTAGDGTQLNVTWNASGIATVTDAA